MKFLRILFADDDRDVRDLVVLRAAKLGHPIETVPSGEALIARVRAGPNDFDVVVTDNDMPGGMDGIIAISILRAERRFGDLPIILHTNNLDPKLKLQAEVLEATFAEKGLFYEDLFKELDALARKQS